MSADRAVLIWDIETSPLLSYTWGLWDQNVIRVKEEWSILSVAWKYLGDPKTHVLALCDLPGYQKGIVDDYQLVAELHGLLSDASVTVAHNGDKFDIKKAQARMIIHGFGPPQPGRSIDTLKEARKHFAFTSNRLDDLGRVLGVGRKIETGGFNLWESCMAGDEAAWKRMKKYNKQDVRLLEDVYLKLRPWMTNHPNIGVLVGELDACPKCGSPNLTKQGIKHNKTTAQQQWRCSDCHGWCSSRVSEKTPMPSLVN